MEAFLNIEFIMRFKLSKTPCRIRRFTISSYNDKFRHAARLYVTLLIYRNKTSMYFLRDHVRYIQ